MRGRGVGRTQVADRREGRHAQDGGVGAESHRCRKHVVPALLTYPPHMAPAVPFALLGVVQLTAVAGWLGLAGASLFPRLRRRVTVLFVAGALALAVAETLTALRFGDPSSDAIAWLRALGLVLVGIGARGGSPQSLALPMPAGLAGVVVPLGSRPTAAVAGGLAGVFAAGAAWWRGTRRGADRWLAGVLAGALLLSGAASLLGQRADSSLDAAVATLAVRGLATVLIGAALVQLARSMLLGKIVGAILAGVVAMAAGAVGVVGTGVASQVQDEQSQRLVQGGRGGKEALTATRRAVRVCRQ